MRPQILTLLTVSSLLLPVAAVAQTPTRSTACRDSLIPSLLPQLRPVLKAEEAFSPTPPEAEATVTAAYRLARSGQGALALQTARSISDDNLRLRVTTRDLIEYLTTDAEFAQVIAILKEVQPSLQAYYAGPLAEKLALKGKLSYAVQALQLISDEPSADNQGRALRDVLVALVKAKRSSEALELIQMMPSLKQKDERISDVAIALAGDKQFSRALDVAQLISSNYFKDVALVRITEALTQNRQLNSALKVAQTIPEAEYRAAGLQAVTGGLLKVGRLDEALQLAQSLESCEIRATTLIQVARRYREMKQTKQAATILDQAFRDMATSKALGSSTEMAINLASEYRQLGNQKQALRLLKQALKATQAIQALPVEGAGSEVLNYRQEKTANLLSKIAREYRLLSQREQALQLLDKALESAQASSHIYPKVGQLRELAAEYKALGRPAKAAELLMQANKLDFR